MCHTLQRCNESWVRSSSTRNGFVKPTDSEYERRGTDSDKSCVKQARKTRKRMRALSYALPNRKMKKRRRRPSRANTHTHARSGRTHTVTN